MQGNKMELTEILSKTILMEFQRSFRLSIIKWKPKSASCKLKWFFLHFTSLILNSNGILSISVTYEGTEVRYNNNLWYSWGAKVWKLEWSGKVMRGQPSRDRPPVSRAYCGSSSSATARPSPAVPATPHPDPLIPPSTLEASPSVSEKIIKQ